MTQPRRTPPRRGDRELFEQLPVSVWPTAQQVARTQRRDRYVPGSAAHPAKMLPAIARHAITRFTTPGDLVGDPMCGIGTTLVEAVHAGRHALGVEYEPRWAELAQANLALAAQLGAPGTGHVVQGDARHVLPQLAEQYAGQLALLLTSPPYGPSLHGHVRNDHSHGVQKFDHTYGHDRGNLAHRSVHHLLGAFTEILRTALPLLRPGGIVAITTRPFRQDGELLDFPSLTLDAAITAGLQPVQRCVALLAGVRDGRLVPRSSFFQLDYVRKLRARGVPAWVIAHEDLLILQAPQKSVGSQKSQRIQEEPKRASAPLWRSDTWVCKDSEGVVA
ncbi:MULTISPECIES: TRM11 family methyltransferase [unclassified Crossiella]|uniref:TRM11 family SAM-dependent methyltransferase n=1 Tax=unclassified Crossiella TaxID=2620835 RepID=UPI001FFE7557|nr:MULTISPECIES: DNA methyltransferase [unclassified Crossiella]MCK2243670.1 site-specific DNA-methyltransferase [Crossiella sp. S99.2]MCK2257529.1 site-specific DNA-methyltransferase [Crossiella sp. S99.1]